VVVAARHGRRTGLEHEHVARGQAPHVAVDRARVVDRESEQAVAQRERVEAAIEACHRDQRSGFRGEADAARVERVVERLDAERVAGQHQPAPPRVPQGEREHPAQALHEGRGRLLVEVEQDLAVAAGAQPMTAATQPRRLFRCVVDVAVAHGPQAAILVGQRLATAGLVDQRQAPVAEAQPAVEVEPAAVGPAVGEARGHRPDGATVGRPAVEAPFTRDPAHVATPLSPANDSRSGRLFPLPAGPARETICSCWSKRRTRTAGGRSWSWAGPGGWDAC
jgi:hypothetical protein